MHHLSLQMMLAGMMKCFVIPLLLTLCTSFLCREVLAYDLAMVRHLPPVTEFNPSFLPKGASVAQKPDILLAPEIPLSQKALDTLMTQGLLSADRASSDLPVTRAELAFFITTVLKHNLNLVSEFPFYRDVPLGHPYYQSIEIAREKQLLDYPQDSGFYHPDKAVTLVELYRAVASAITGPTPQQDETDYLLIPFPETASLSEPLKPLVAKMVRAQFFQLVYNAKVPAIPVAVSRPLTPKSIAPFLIGLNQLIKTRTQFNASKVETTLPDGLLLEVSPAKSILESDLTVGTTLLFTVITITDSLPRGTRMEGIVSIVQPAQHRYTVALRRAIHPDGSRVKMRAQLTLVEFKQGSGQNFLVPGQRFPVITQETSLEKLLERQTESVIEQTPPVYKKVD